MSIDKPLLGGSADPDHGPGRDASVPEYPGM
jgi:hypothetical protein